jgi:hypothetical protein
MTIYRPNPFLEVLRDTDYQYLILCFYAQLKIDFFDLLNVPLINSVSTGQKIINTEVKFYKFEQGRHASWVRAFFEGFVDIELHTENGDKYQTYLPVNLHAAAKISGYNPKSKKRIIDPYGLKHHTLPLKWSLFDIIESREYSRKGRKSRWDKNVSECRYIHFDNSFKILCYDQKTSYGYQQYLIFGKPFEKFLKVKWSTETSEYIEVSDFTILERLFHERFVNQKRRTELFDALELKYVKKEGRPKKISGDGH